jgi:AcrR family transcriptional regulator
MTIAGRETAVVKADVKRPHKRRQRGSINADDIVAGAFEVARASSLDQLSMPMLAEHLDVAVTSIYWHFRRKEELLNAMTDVAVECSEQYAPEVRPHDRWQDTLRAAFTALRDLHTSDHVLSDLLFMRTSSYGRQATFRTMQQLERIVVKLVDDGFTPENAIRCINAISVYTRGMIIHDLVLRRSGAPTLDSRQRRMTDWTALPVLDGLIDTHPLAGTSDEDFEFGISRLICSFEQVLTEQNRATRSVLPTTERTRRPA